MIDSADPSAQGRWWAEAIGGKVVVLADPEGNEFCVLTARE